MGKNNSAVIHCSKLINSLFLTDKGIHSFVLIAYIFLENPVNGVRFTQTTLNLTRNIYVQKAVALIQDLKPYGVILFGNCIVPYDLVPMAV